MNNITAFDFKANVSQKVNKSEFVILNEDNEDVADEIDQNALRAAMESELAEMQEKAMRGELNREEKGIMKSIESYLYPVVLEEALFRLTDSREGVSYAKGDLS